MFGRKKRASAPVETRSEEVTVTLPTLADEHPIWDEPGPRSAEEVDSSLGYLDHGALRIPAVHGMRVEPLGPLNQGVAAGIRLVIDTSLVEIEAYAAPKSGGVWDSMRQSLRELALQHGAQVEEKATRYGVEHLVTIPVTMPDGGQGQTYVREIGHEGPRWVSRIKMVGQAAVDPQAGAEFERLIDRIVVVRGGEPRARLEILPVSFAQQAPQVPDAS